MHKPNAQRPSSNAEAVSAKGSRTYHIHPRVPKEFRGVVGATHVTRSLKTHDLKEAKRRVHAVMDSLYAEWEAKLAAMSISPPLANLSRGSKGSLRSANAFAPRRRPPDIEHAGTVLPCEAARARERRCREWSPNVFASAL